MPVFDITDWQLPTVAEASYPRDVEIAVDIECPGYEYQIRDVDGITDRVSVFDSERLIYLSLPAIPFYIDVVTFRKSYRVTIKPRQFPAGLIHLAAVLSNGIGSPVPVRKTFQITE
jgi:hypothetical protein